MRVRSVLFAITLVACLFTAPLAHALGRARQGFGIGIGSGTLANGVSAKVMAGPGAFQGVAGFWGGGGARDRYGNAGGVAGSLDYLFEMPILVRTEYFDIDWSFGLGGGVGVPTVDGRVGAAASGIAGLEFNFTAVPIDLTIEFRPTVGLVPDPGVDLLDFTAHLRLWL